MDSAFSVRNAIKDKYGMTVNYVHKADILFNEGKFKEAASFYLKCAEKAKENNYSNLEKYYYNYASICFEKAEDYKQAFTTHKKYQQLQDSLVTTETNKKVEQLKIEFETEKKENEILQQRTQLAEQKNYILIASV